MKAMIMAAGRGTRLMPLTRELPKPMIPMGNRPLMENIMVLLKKHGFQQAIVNLHHQGEIIKNHFGGGEGFGIQIQYSPEKDLKGTAGGVKQCQSYFDETFAVVSGDVLTDIDFQRLLAGHRDSGALATVALKEMEAVEKFGVVETDENNRILQFQEKPHRDAAISRKASAGIYIFEPEIFKYIPGQKFYDFGKQLFPHLVKIQAPFYGTVIDEYWCDIGDFATYRQCHHDQLAGKIDYRPRGERIESGTAILLQGENCDIAATVEMSGFVVLGSGCVVREGAVLKDTIIWENTIVKEEARLQECIIGSHCWIGRDVAIRPGAVIASHCRIESRVEIPERLKVFNSVG